MEIKDFQQKQYFTCNLEFLLSLTQLHVYLNILKFWEYVKFLCILAIPLTVNPLVVSFVLNELLKVCFGQSFLEWICCLWLTIGKDYRLIDCQFNSKQKQFNRKHKQLNSKHKQFNRKQKLKLQGQNIKLYVLF